MVLGSDGVLLSPDMKVLVGEEALLSTIIVLKDRGQLCSALVAGMWEKGLAILSTTFSTIELTNASGNIEEHAVSALFSGTMTDCSVQMAVDCVLALCLVLRELLLVALGFVEGWRHLGRMTICNSK